MGNHNKSMKIHRSYIYNRMHPSTLSDAIALIMQCAIHFRYNSNTEKDIRKWVLNTPTSTCIPIFLPLLLTKISPLQTDQKASSSVIDVSPNLSYQQHQPILLLSLHCLCILWFLRMINACSIQSQTNKTKIYYLDS